MSRRADFTATVRGGRRGTSPSVIVHSQSVSGYAAAPSVGFIVGRAVGNAVTRNRVRRRLRHLMRDRLAALPATVGLVVRATPAAARLDSAALAGDLDRALLAAARREGSR